MLPRVLHAVPKVKIKSGVTEEVPGLVAFMVGQTGDPAPKNALYVGVYEQGEGDTELLGCLIFYAPFVEGERRGLKFGGALAPGKRWGAGLSSFIDLRNLVEDVVFSRAGFGYDVLDADVRRCNDHTIGLLRGAGFAIRIRDCETGIDTYRYLRP